MEGCEYGRGHQGNRMIRFEHNQTNSGGEKMEKRDSRANGTGSFVRKSAGDEELTSPLPMFGNCPEIHTSKPPDLPEVGESEIQAKSLFSHPAISDGQW